MMRRACHIVLICLAMLAAGGHPPASHASGLGGPGVHCLDHGVAVPPADPGRRPVHASHPCPECMPPAILHLHAAGAIGVGPGLQVLRSARVPGTGPVQGPMRVTWARGPPAV